MNLLLLKGSLTLMLMQCCFLSFGQTINQQLTPEEIANRVAYVHGNDFVLNYPDLVAVYGKVMTERIEYSSLPQSSNEKFPLISSFPLMAKVNPSIQGPDFSNFQLNEFNPLVYNLDFFSDKTLAFRIDNTNYVMFIQPIVRN
jgi:hypothetical protein